MRVRTIAAIAVLAAVLTGCSQAEPGAEPAARTSAPSAPEATASPTPTVAKPMTVGQPWLWEAEDGSASGKTTVLGYTQPVSSVGNAAEEAGEQGYVWSAVEAKVCVDKGTLLTGHANWALAYEDGAVVQPSSSMYDDFPKPEYPIETTVKAGRCVRGKVVFPVPGSQRPSLVTFSPVGAESATAEWTVSAK